MDRYTIFREYSQVIMGKSDQVILGQGCLFLNVEYIPVFKPECKINKLITGLNFGKLGDQYSGDFWKIQAEEVKGLIFKKSKRLFKREIIIL